MKKLIYVSAFVASVFASFHAAQSGQSSSVGTLEIQCQGMSPTLGGIPMTLNIEEFFSPRKKASFRIATLETDMEGQSDRLLRRRVEPNRAKSPTAPLIYTGYDFVLEIHMGGTPSTSGAYAATITAELRNGMKLVEPMVCSIYPMVTLTK